VVPGFEPGKCRIIDPVPYLLAIPPIFLLSFLNIQIEVIFVSFHSMYLFDYDNFRRKLSSFKYFSFNVLDTVLFIISLLYLDEKDLEQNLPLA